MLKVSIRMDEDKIKREEKYSLDTIYRSIDELFQKMELPRMEDSSDSLVYRDCGRPQDFGRFGYAVITLKNHSWFMENVAEWFLYDSDDSDDPEDFNVEDLRKHYRQKLGMEA